MSIPHDVSIDPRGAVFDVLDEVKAGMLGLTGGGDGFQPMTHFLDGSAGVIWFISSAETDLVQSLGQGEDADYVVISQDHDVHISLRGKL
jgi:general stress protein 26